MRYSVNFFCRADFCISWNSGAFLIFFFWIHISALYQATENELKGVWDGDFKKNDKVLKVTDFGKIVWASTSALKLK
jgi:hypothetical protein